MGDLKRRGDDSFPKYGKFRKEAGKLRKEKSMKKQLKSIVALGAAAVMELASVMTASAEVA